MAGKIFINYRRGDDPGFTQALFSHLEHAFSSDQLFIDIDGIEPGMDFVQVLADQVAKCDIVLTVIGKGWIDARDEQNTRRLDNPEDFVRIEIVSALEQAKRVIPILVGNAAMPRSEELPEALKPLARRHAVRLTHDRFRSDTEGLIKSLQRVLETAEQQRQSEEAAARETEIASARIREETAARQQAEQRRLVAEAAARASEEEAARLARETEERRRAKEAETEQAQRLAAIEAARKASEEQERAEARQRAQEEAARLAREAQERRRTKEAETEQAQRLAAIEAARRVAEEQERAEARQRAQEEATRLASEAEERRRAKEAEAEQAQRFATIETARKAAEEQERAEARQRAQEEAARLAREVEDEDERRSKEAEDGRVQKLELETAQGTAGEQQTDAPRAAQVESLSVNAVDTSEAVKAKRRKIAAAIGAAMVVAAVAVLTGVDWFSNSEWSVEHVRRVALANRLSAKQRCTPYASHVGQHENTAALIEIAANYGPDLAGIRNNDTLPELYMTGYTVVIDRIVSDTSKFNSLIPSIISAHPDIVVLCGSASEMSDAKSQAQKAGLLR
jgi:DNA segregation ATPase FtsK/SpoIIIE-like protein